VVSLLIGGVVCYILAWRLTAPIKKETAVEITLRALPGDNGPYALLTVRDHGPGVPEMALTEIFRPFYRVADARDRQSSGTGIGLAIVERALHAHNGTVAARNVPDGGLLVEIRLPIQEADTR
jgi:signal transduction histidine kinase